MANRKGESDQARAARAKMTERQRERIDELPYARLAFTIDDALDALKAEVTRRQQEQPGGGSGRSMGWRRRGGIRIGRRGAGWLSALVIAQMRSPDVPR